MAKVTTLKNWCEIDQLNSVDLRDGDTVEITWPNGGEKTTHTVHIEKSTQSVSDMGRSVDVPIRHAMIKLCHGGAWFDIRIAGLEARKI